MTPMPPDPLSLLNRRTGSANWIAFALCVAYLAVMAMLMWLFESAQTLLEVSEVQLDSRRLNAWLLILVTTALIFIFARWFLERTTVIPQDESPTRSATWHSAPSKYASLIALAGLAVLITASGFFVVYEQEGALKAARFRQIGTVAESKRRLVALWMDERERDLITLKSNERLVEAVQQLLTLPPTREPEVRIRAIDAMVRANGFDGASLVDRAGRVRLNSPPDHTASQACVAHAKLAPEADASVLMMTRAAADSTGAPHLDAVARIRQPGGAGLPLATLCLSIDLSARLLPELARWPLPTQTGEILLGRFDGDDVIVLNHARQGQEGWVMARLAGATPRWRATLAATAAGELFERDLDHGHTMLRAALAVPSSNWFVLARMDEDEADQRQGRTQRRLVMVAGLGLIFAVGVAMLGWARARSAALVHSRERESMLVKLTGMAYYDELTQLPRRHLTQDRLAVAIAQARRDGGGVGVLVVDLDGFKLINDRYGHAAGDAVLQATAQRMTARLREGDTAGRLGGDEFMAVLPGCPDATALARVGRNMAEALNAPLSWNGQTLNVRASVGGALFPTHASTLADLSEAADQAMYVAKQGSGGFNSAPLDSLST